MGFSLKALILRISGKERGYLNSQGVEMFFFFLL